MPTHLLNRFTARRHWVLASGVVAVGLSGCVALKEHQSLRSSAPDSTNPEAGSAPTEAGPDAGAEVGPSPLEEAGDAMNPDAPAEVAPADAADGESAVPCTLANTPAGGSCDLAVSPSCQGLPATCGPGESCCLSTHVPADSFLRSYDKSEAALQDGRLVVGLQSSTSTPATLSDFWLDRYEVTVGRFRRFLAVYDAWRSNKPFDNDGIVHHSIGTGWSVNLDGPSLPRTKDGILSQLTSTGCGSQSAWSDGGASGIGSNSEENKPVTCVSWFVAFAFCVWDGGRFPTEAEWNYAATGGTQQRAFPWSQPEQSVVVSRQLANLDNASGLVAVGSLPSGLGRWGHQDMAGNAMEWTRDACTDCSPPSATDPGSELTSYTKTPMCTDCVQTTGTSRIVRGGSFKFWTAFGRTASRTSNPPGNAYDDVGFRCARNPAN